MKTYPVYLNGELTFTENSYVVNNPATEEAVARMSVVDRPVVFQAIADGHAAFPAWRQLPGKARGDLLYKIANELHRRREEIARLITQENGKPVTESHGEIAMAVDHLRWFSGEAPWLKPRHSLPPPPVRAGNEHKDCCQPCVLPFRSPEAYAPGSPALVSQVFDSAAHTPA